MGRRTIDRLTGRRPSPRHGQARGRTTSRTPRLLPPPTASTTPSRRCRGAVAHQLGIGLGQLPERAVQEGDVGLPSARRSRPRARSRAGSAPHSSALTQLRERVRRPASAPQPRPVSVGVVAVGADALGQRGEQPGEQGVARAGRTRARARPARASRRAAAGRRCRGGRARRRRGRPRAGGRGAGGRCWRAGRARRRAPCAEQAAVERGELAIHREARLVAERLEHREQVHFGLTVPGIGHIFKVYTVLFGIDGPHRRTPTTRSPGPRAESVTRAAQRRRRPAACSRACSIPSCAPRSSTSGMVRRHRRRARRRRHGEGRAHHRRLPAAGPDRQRRESKVAGLPGVRDVKVEYDEMTQEERSRVMQRARFKRSQSRAAHRVSRHHPRDRGRRAARAASASRRSP